jgi:hypothetical protein
MRLLIEHAVVLEHGAVNLGLGALSLQPRRLARVAQPPVTLPHLQQLHRHAQLQLARVLLLSARESAHEHAKSKARERDRVFGGARPTVEAASSLASSCSSASSATMNSAVCAANDAASAAAAAIALAVARRRRPE